MSSLGWIILLVLALWLVIQRAALHGLRREVEATRRDMYRGQYDAEEKLHRLDADLQVVKLDARAREGTLRVGPYVRVSEAAALHPNVERVLGRFHIVVGNGREAETLAEAAASYSQDLEAVLTAIHTVLEDPNAAVGEPPVADPADDAFEV